MATTVPNRTDVPDNSLGNLYSLRGTLRVLNKYLRHIQAVCEQTNEGPSYLIDWEMIQEAIEPADVEAVYSGVLWYALESHEASDPSGARSKVFIPEGTRRELAQYLARLVSRFNATWSRVSLRAQQQTHPTSMDDLLQIVGSQSDYGRPDWKEVLQLVFELNRIGEAVDRLVLILKRYARPIPFNPEQISAPEVQFYERRLGRLRSDPNDAGRNRADALNLASLELMRSSESGQLAGLVTATRAVLTVGQQFTSDPVCFVLETAIRRHFPDPLQRQRMLEIMNARVLTLIVKLNEIIPEQPTEEPKRLTRGTFSDFLESLKGLYDDPVLSEFARLFSMAIQAIENAVSQARRLATDLQLPEDTREGGLGSLHRKARLVADTLGPISAPAAGLKWVRGADLENVSRHTLVDSNNRVILAAERTASRLTLCWETYESISGFCEFVDRLVVGSDTQTHFNAFVRLPSICGLKHVAVSRVCEIPNEMSSFDTDLKASFVRIDWADSQFWYDFGEMYKTDRLQDPMEQPRIAVSISRNSPFEDVIQFFENTALNWTLPVAVRNLVSQLAPV
jgi:hypothetical protein